MPNVTLTAVQRGSPWWMPCKSGARMIVVPMTGLCGGYVVNELCGHENCAPRLQGCWWPSPGLLPSTTIITTTTPPPCGWAGGGFARLMPPALTRHPAGTSGASPERFLFVRAPAKTDDRLPIICLPGGDGTGCVLLKNEGDECTEHAAGNSAGAGSKASQIRTRQLMLGCYLVSGRWARCVVVHGNFSDRSC